MRCFDFRIICSQTAAFVECAAVLCYNFNNVIKGTVTVKVAICEDEKSYALEIKEQIELFSKENCIDFDISVFTCAEDMLKSGGKFDIAVLDVEMDGKNGIELGETLRKINPHIALMYVTAYNKYLDDALNLSAVRFFEKPLDKGRFYRGLSDAVKRIDNSTVSFYLKDGKTTERVNACDIIYIEIENRKSKVVTQEKEYHSAAPIGFWRDKLKSSVFASPHKSFIVNLNYVTSYERNSIILNNKYHIAVSRNRQTEFYKTFMRFMEGR